MADPSTPTPPTMPSMARALRVAAVAEGVSYLLVLSATVLKYVFEAGPNGEGWVPVVGPIHGIIVLVYAGLVLLGREEQGWSIGETILALVLSAVPFGGFYVEQRMITIPPRPTPA